MKNIFHKWLTTIDQLLTFAASAEENYATGTLSGKRVILSALGSNLLLKDKKLNVDLTKSLLPLQKVATSIQAHMKQFEPLTNPMNKKALEDSFAKSPNWLASLSQNGGRPSPVRTFLILSAYHFDGL